METSTGTGCATSHTLRALGAAPALPVGEGVKGAFAELGADAVALFEDLVGKAHPATANGAGPAAAGGGGLTQDQVCAVLTSLCDLLYAGSKLEIDAWNADRWKNDSAALQDWVTQVLVEALVANGLCKAPPTAPGAPFTQLQAYEYMLAMAAWEPGFMDAAVGFVQAGYQYWSSFEPDPNAYGPVKWSEVVSLTRLADALMGLKSAEPYDPAPDPSS